jgi:hypothetical protein
MFAPKSMLMATMCVASVLTFGGMAATAQSKKSLPEGVPQIVHMELRSTYLVAPKLDAVIGPQFRVRVRGSIYVRTDVRHALAEPTHPSPSHC